MAVLRSQRQVSKTEFEIHFPCCFGRHENICCRFQEDDSGGCAQKFIVI